MPPTTSSAALSLLHRAHSPAAADRIHTERVLQRPLHLKPTTSDPNAQETRRALRSSKRSLTKRKKALKPAPLSSRQRKALCIYDIPSSARDYSLYVPLHELWMRYIQDLLGLTTLHPVEKGRGGAGNVAAPGKVKRSVSVQEAARLCSADFHGAELEVVRSKCVGRVGIKGIVVKDGMRAFEIVTRGKGTGKDGKEKLGEVKVVPKEGTWFAFIVELPKDENETGKEAEKLAEDTLTRDEKGSGRELRFELHGSQFIYRAADRANRKFKSHFLKNL